MRELRFPIVEEVGMLFVLAAVVGIMKFDILRGDLGSEEESMFII